MASRSQPAKPKPNLFSRLFSGSCGLRHSCLVCPRRFGGLGLEGLSTTWLGWIEKGPICGGLGASSWVLVGVEIAPDLHNASTAVGAVARRSHLPRRHHTLSTRNSFVPGRIHKFPPSDMACKASLSLVWGGMVRAGFAACVCSIPVGCYRGLCWSLS